MLSVEGLTASYGTYRALFDVSFEVPDGGAVALIGANGAGKSTVARVVAGLVPVTDGRVHFAGREVTRVPAHRRARAGLVHVPEGRGVFGSLTVEENLTLPLRQKLGRHGWRDALARSYAAFPMLADRRAQLGGTLSGGQQRILSLAKALAAPPPLLVVDELSLGLAPRMVATVYEALGVIRQQGTALLLVEQHLSRALEFADRVVLLNRGMVAWHGSAGDAAAAVDRLWRGTREG